MATGCVRLPLPARLLSACLACAETPQVTTAHCCPTAAAALLGSCTPAGKSDPVVRKRTLGITPAGQRVWVPAELYTVLFTIAGPLPSR